MGKLSILLTSLLICFSSLEVQGQEASAIFDGKGIKGYINFTVVPEGVRIQTRLQGLVGRHRWHVHLFPVDQTLSPNVQCLGNYVGPHYDPFNQNNGTGDYTARCQANQVMCEAGDLSGKFGYLMDGMDLNVVDNTSTLFLRGRFSIVGRSIVIHSNIAPYPNFECATIRSEAELSGSAPVTILQSTFVNPIAGVMYFKQVEGEEVQMWGKVFWVNGMGDTMNHNWHIHENNPGEVFRAGECNTMGNIGGHFRPFNNGPPSIANYTLVCNPDLLTGCEVGDLTGKHDIINVPGSPTPYSSNAFFFTDSFLNLTGVNAVENRSIAIHEANRSAPVVACAPLIESETITLRQYGEGEVTISQTSPFEDTIITNSKNKEMAVIQNAALAPLNQECAGSPDLIFNSYPVVSNPVSSDRFPTGALKDRYGGNSGTFRVYDIPVYGSGVSISSLNIRAARDGNNNCSALITSLTGSDVILAKAQFGGNLRGAVYFIQRDYDTSPSQSNLGNTFIIIDVYSTGQASANNQTWNIVSTSSCTSSSAPFNPYNISTTGSDCTTLTPLRCAMGDLSNKHGYIRVGADTTNRNTYTFVDNNLLLTGPSSVLGYSVGISGSGGATCGIISRTYISDSRFTVTVNRNSDTTRASMIAVLATEARADVSDIVVLNQRTVKVGDLECLEVNIRAFGTTQTAANDVIARLNSASTEIEGKIKCSSALMSASVSFFAIAFSLMVTWLFSKD